VGVEKWVDVCGHVSVAVALLFVPAVGVEAKKRVREWDKGMACPTDAPVLVGSAGAIERFTALSACSDVRAVAETRASAVADAAPDSEDYTVRQTQRDPVAGLKRVCRS